MTQTLRNTHTEACTSSFSCLSFFGGSTILTPSVFSSSRLSRGLGFLLQWHTAHGPSHVSPIDVDHVTVWNEQSRSQRMTGYGEIWGKTCFPQVQVCSTFPATADSPLLGFAQGGKQHIRPNQADPVGSWFKGEETQQAFHVYRV